MFFPPKLGALGIAAISMYSGYLRLGRVSVYGISLSLRSRNTLMEQTPTMYQMYTQNTPKTPIRLACCAKNVIFSYLMLQNCNFFSSEAAKRLFH